MGIQLRHVHSDHHLHARRVVATAAFAVLVPVTAWAQLSVEITPLRVDVKTAPGAAPYTQTVQVGNHGKEAVRVHARVDDWYISRDGTPQFKPADGTSAFSAASWIRVNPVESSLAPGAATTVRFTITTPAGTAAGGYRAAIMFDLLPPGSEPGARGRSVMFQGRIATVIYATVGTVRPVVELADLQARLQKGQPPRWTVVATLKNTSRVHARTKGQVVVYDKGGTVVRRLPVPDVPVLPESERELAVALAGEREDPLPPGDYRVEVRIDIGLPELLVGETTVTIPR